MWRCTLEETRLSKHRKRVWLFAKSLLKRSMANPSESCTMGPSWEIVLFTSVRIDNNVKKILSLQTQPVTFKLKHPFITAAGQKTETHNVKVTLTLDDGTKG